MTLELRKEALSRMRARVKNDWFFDTARIYRRYSHYDAAGTHYSTELPVLYEEKADVPCRMISSRYFRQPDLMGQEIVVSDFDIFFPHDVDLKQDDRIEMDDGYSYEIRKFNSGGATRMDVSVLATRITQGTHN